MAKIIDDPQKETGLPAYPQEFSDEVKSGAKNLAKQGYTQDQIQGWMNEKYKRYNTEHKGSDVQYEDEPEWAKSERIEKKNTTKKRGLINRLGRALNMSMSMTPASTSYGVGVGVSYTNPKRDAGVDDKDVIDSNMINSTDEHVKTLLNDEDRRDASIDVGEHVEATREALATEFNPLDHRTQRWNNEILMEESYSEVISAELSERVAAINKEHGTTNTDFILSDPKKIKKMKKDYIEMGYTGKMVDRAFDKVLFEGKRESFVETYDNSVIDNNDPKVLESESGKNVIGGQLYNSFVERGAERFNKDELDRMQANIRLEELRTQKADPKTIAQVEEEIKVLDEHLGYDTTEKAATSAVSYAGGVFMPGGMSVPNQVKVGTEDWANEVYYRMYDKTGAKIMRGDETQEEVEHQQQVTEVIKENEDIKDLPERLLQEGLKSEKIILILQDKKEKVMEKMHAELTDAKSPFSEESRRDFTEIPAYKRQIKLINEEIRQENIRSEAVSRMYLLNQNVALEDRNLKTLAGLGAATIRDINVLPFNNTPNPSIEQVRGVADGLYAELGIDMDEKEWDAVKNTLVTEVVEGGAHLTDIALKMMLLDKAGFGAINEWLTLIGKGGPAYRAVSGIAKMGLEEGKFQMVGGSPGTGASFYAANKIMPSYKGSKQWLNVLYNGYMKGTLGMTVAMEGSAQIEAAFHAGANDNDVIREMTETFGPLDVAQRRILVNLLSATPFGIKGMYERGAMPIVDPKKVREIADQVDKNGKHEAAGNLKSMAATLGDSKVYEKYTESMYKIDKLKENDKYDRSDSMAEVNKKYETLMGEEGQVDGLKNKKVSALLGKYENEKVEFDAREYAGKLETLRLNKVNVTEKTPLSEIDAKYAEIIEKSNEYMGEIKEMVQPEAETSELIDPTRKAKATEYEGDKKVAQAKRGIKSIVKDVNWKKAIKGPAQHIAKTIKELKERVDGKTEAERPDVRLKVEEKDGRFFVKQAEGETKEFKTKKEAERFVENFELLTQGERTFEEQKKMTDEKKGKGTETFDEIIERFSGLKNGTRELKAMVNMLFETKNKNEALEIVGKIEDIVHQVELITRPEAGRAEFITRSPNQGESAVSKYSDFRGNIMAYKRGQREGRKDLTERANEVYEFIKTRMPQKLVEKVLTASEIKSLAKPLPANATAKDVAKRLDRMEKLFVKLETRQFKADLIKTFRSLSPKVVGANVTEGKIGIVGGAKILTSDVLFSNNVEGAKSITTKLKTLREGFKGDKFVTDFIDAQINALKVTGSRELAMERQAFLEVEHKTRELTNAEKLEYELLGLVDGTKMNHIDALRAKETVAEIERTGRLVQERTDQSKKVINAINIQEGIASINVDQLKIEGMEQINPKKPGFFEAIKEQVKWANKYVGSSHESFITMMEMLSSGDPNRTGPWEGFFHTMSKDFHRSREREVAEKNKMLNKMRTDVQNITGLKGRKFDKWAKRNSKKALPFTYDIANNVQAIKNGVTIDQAVRWWQMLHNKATWPLWGKMGFGVKGEKFEVAEVERLMDAIENFVVENHGNRKALEVGEYQMNKYSELYRDVNEVYSKQHGTDLGYTMHYVPVVFEKGVMKDANGNDVNIETYTDILDKSSEFRVASSAPVFTKATQRSGNIKLDLSLGSEQVFADYLSSAMHYKHFQEPLRRADSVFGNNNIKKAISAKYGKKAGGYINKVMEKSLKDIGADAAAGTKIEWLTKLKNNFTVANLGANVILLPKQLMSVDAYRAGLRNPAEEALFTKHLMSFMVDGWGAMGELNRSEMMVNRAAGHSYNKELLEMQKKAAKLYKVGKLRPGNLNEGLLFATKLGDRTAILIGGQALYRTKIDTYKKQGMSESAAKKKAYEDFVTFTKLTQQSGNIEDLGHIQRAGTLGKYATLFQNTPHQYYRMEMAALRNGSNAARRLKGGKLTPEQKAQAKSTIKRSARDFFVYHFVLPMTFRAASQGFYLGGDDKGRDRFVDDEGQIVTAALGSLSYPFVLGDMLTNMLSKVVAGHSFDTEIGGVAQDVIGGTEEMIQTIKDIGSAEDFQLEWARIMDGTAAITFADILNFFGTAAEYTGIPVRSPALMIKGASDFRNRKTDDIRAWAGYSSGVLGHYDRSPQYNTMAPYLGSVGNLEPFLAKMRKHTDPDYYNMNQKRWTDEFIMYNHYKGYNEDVNYLYTTSKTNRDRAKYLRAIRDGKGMRAPLSIADLIQSFQPPMNTGQFENYIQELLEFKVITPAVLVEMDAQDKQYKKKMVKEFRKTGR